MRRPYSDDQGRGKRDCFRENERQRICHLNVPGRRQLQEKEEKKKRGKEGGSPSNSLSRMESGRKERKRHGAGFTASEGKKGKEDLIASSARAFAPGP